MQKDFWHHKRVLVTGAGGFIGSHLTKRLEAFSAQVFRVSRRDDGVDIADRKALEPFFQKKPSIIFHLAGEALVERGKEAPYDTFRTNLMGTLNILELSRVYHIPRVIIASTAHVYGEGQPPFHEEDPPRPSRPYETSKTATDLLAQSYADSFHLPVVIPRFANIYGPGDTNFARLIPKTLRCIVQKKPVPMWGGTAKREYLYIDDAVEAYRMLAELSDAKLERNRIFNFGSGNPIAVADLIKTIGELVGVPVQIIKKKDAREGEIPDQYVSWKKARRIVGWQPRVSLNEGLLQTISWYQQHLSTINATAS